MNKAAQRYWSLVSRLALAGCAVLLFTAFVALGTWQVERRVWKLDLIARVNQRVQAPPVAPPSPASWLQLSAATHEYRHLRLAGYYLPGRQTWVQASTALGSGFWLLAPLQLADGSQVLVNRGFVPAASHALTASSVVIAEPDGPVTVIGLLRMTEPGGGFLRKNDAAAERWFSRDVAAISAARHLGHAAPYFVDADAAVNAQEGQPVGGLTIVAFYNSHLGYALTWYALALMVVVGTVVFVRTTRRQNTTSHDD